MKILPGLDLLAAATASNELLQQDPKLQAKEEMPNISASKITLTKEDEIAIQFSETNDISLSISYLCLSQSDWDLELATEAIAFAAEFARLKGLELQASILCLDYNLWDMDNAILFVKTVVQEVSDKTGMTLDWAMECLASNEWTVNKAVEAFEDVKVNKFFPLVYCFCFPSLFQPFLSLLSFSPVRIFVKKVRCCDN